MRRYIKVNIIAKTVNYFFDECDSAFYDKESDSIKVHKENSMIMIPYREVLSFKTTFTIKE